MDEQSALLRQGIKISAALLLRNVLYSFRPDFRVYKNTTTMSFSRPDFIVMNDGVNDHKKNTDDIDAGWEQKGDASRTRVIIPDVVQDPWCPGNSDTSTLSAKSSTVVCLETSLLRRTQAAINESD
jgi:hypothetical protein